MLLDLQTMFSGAVGAKGTKSGQMIAASAISTNVIDLVESGALEVNPPLWIAIQVLTSTNAADAAKTVTFSLESDNDAGLATAPVVHWKSPPIVGAALVAGYDVARFQLPAGDYKRYLGLRYTVSDTFTAFGVVAHMSPSIPSGHIYASSIS